MKALEEMHKLQNIQNLAFEFTFMIGAFLNVFFFVQAQDKSVPLDTAVAFSQIALVNGMRGNFNEMMNIVVNYSEYEHSRHSMDL